MRLSSAIRAALVMTVTCIGLATAAHADNGSIRFNVIKAGFVIGGSAGSGTLVISWPALSALDWRSELWLYLRRLSDRFCRYGQQHPKAVRC
jgi:hypothetical protein